ncbi:MAG: hypothetical protein HY079_08715 [Elusimicrobia bacterium]|nr:hypothetical protein [Elusimicrobiota bacterium]
MENKDAAAQDAKDGGACCSKGKCCGCKALAAVALLAIGAAGGWFAARHCCAVKDAPAAVAPAK